MKLVLKVLGALLLLIALSGGGFFAWASTASARTIATHTVDFPIPFPLDAGEAAGLGDEEAGVLAFERAVERGRHLVAARYVCSECHGVDMGGGVMIDAPVIGRIFGPNLTGGSGSRVTSFTPADWDRIVRHGMLADGRPAAMPAEDFQRMSDQELSDIVAYIRHRGVHPHAAPGRQGDARPDLRPAGKGADGDR